MPLGADQHEEQQLVRKGGERITGRIRKKCLKRSNRVQNSSLKKKGTGDLIYADRFRFFPFYLFSFAFF
jgi:hypothetical protein